MRRATRYQQACEDFDASERAFGQCKRCGFSLADHLRRNEPEEDGEHDDLNTDTEEAAPAEEEAAEEVNEPKACGNFTFAKGSYGLCVCGFPMEEHKADDQKSSTFRRSLRHLAKRISKRVSSKREPCENFAIDLNSDQYGQCSCGFTKPEHDKAAKRRAEKEARALARTRSTPIMSASGKIVGPCTHFELDMKSEGGYGVCVCGFPRERHQNFTMRPSEWESVKSALTKPKPFE
mmetsp:Transcript_15912/g.30799  ORF Transcript_15912/g.30799 Transcript_15912/m.30799 type:complete len:235 (-) Transcript_15912:517-1221(-)|eukprot:CAMPEP_0171494786 /NCGR_PEP_ID=MMETSP0958-20121227/5754_1 /TAXON_ID=87120 /ORGANISM="Aurantiochytrium limacinum, Strain ATCCMYA-1381" /LENGTH=234 /DNA_ID=CAMNT_0012028645 /DNA_START=264 /DNA_END=968 /DNA_ORIENTATION=-